MLEWIVERRRRPMPALDPLGAQRPFPFTVVYEEKPEMAANPATPGG